MQEFQVNEYLSLRLEDDRTIIYVGKVRFRQCKFLLLNIKTEEIQYLDEIESIDEAAERLDKSQEGLGLKEIPPETEFWGHCSNLQVWYENNYDTRLLHSNLAFPLLKKLTEVGDLLAQNAIKREIIERYRKGTVSTKKLLLIEGYLSFLTLDERLNLLLNNDDFTTLIELSGEILIESPLPAMEVLMECVKIEDRKIIELDLDNFGLYKFPNSILNFESLEVLSLRSNFLKEIPRKIKKLKKLREIWLSNNRLWYIPNSICSMKNIETLWLGENRLKWVPKHIGKMINLRILQLSNNRLKTLPASICNLSYLEKLYLLSNSLSSLPECFYELKSLKYIDIRDNRLRKYPNVLKKIKSLRNVEIELKK